jgi:hypothetical protein
MATTLPALDATTHAASVTYACTFALTETDDARVTFTVPQPVQFTFGFETGMTQQDPAVDLIDIASDTSWFDQDAIETAIKGALGTICGAIAALLGTDQAVIEATVRVERTWRINPDQIGSAAPVKMPSAPVIYAEMMAYP